MPAGSSSRSLCSRCAWPLRGCLCRFVPQRIASPVELLILQHPLEQGHQKGTAPLLALSLAGCRLVVGERFEPAALQALLRGPDAQGRPRQPWLLYPPDPPGTAVAPALPPPALAPPPPEQLRLVLLDGTWRKSRLLLHLNPPLQALPRLSLAAEQAVSRYRIRKAQRSGQLSSLESALLALQALDACPARYQPLWQGFERFLAEREQLLLPSHRVQG